MIIPHQKVTKHVFRKNAHLRSLMGTAVPESTTSPSTGATRILSSIVHCNSEEIVYVPRYKVCISDRIVHLKVLAVFYGQYALDLISDIDIRSMGVHRRRRGRDTPGRSAGDLRGPLARVAVRQPHSRPVPVLDLVHHARAPRGGDLLRVIRLNMDRSGSELRARRLVVVVSRVGRG